MKEDKLSLVKAVDSGDTDLGDCVIHIFAFLADCAIFSLPCLVALTQKAPPWLVLPTT